MGQRSSDALTIVAGKIIELRERDYSCVPRGSGIALRQAELAIVLNDLDDVLKDCPPHLILSRLEVASPDLRTFPDYLIEGLPQFQPGSRLITNDPKRAFIIQQANLYITHVGVFCR